MPLLPRTIVPFYSLHISLSYSRSTVESYRVYRHRHSVRDCKISQRTRPQIGVQDVFVEVTSVDGIVVIVEAERLASLPCRSVELSRASSCMMTGKRARASIMSNAIPSYWSDPSSKIFCWNKHVCYVTNEVGGSDPLDDDMVTGGLCLVVLAALRGQEAGGDHVASGTVVLVEDVQATFVVVAGVLGRLRDLSSGLAKQSLFLYALLLALSGLAAASVVASLFVSGHDTQLVGEAALVAGVASGAGDGSVTEEDDVEGDEEQEHDESFDGKESVGVHMWKKLLLCWVVNIELSKRRTTTSQRIDIQTSKHKLWAYEGYDRCHTSTGDHRLSNLISANPQHSSRKNSERTSKRKLSFETMLQTVDLAISFQLIVNAVPVEMQNKLPSRSLPRERECVCVGAFSVDTARRCQNIMPSDGYLKPCRSRGRSLKCDVSTRAHRPNNLLISYWLSHGLVLVEVQRDLRAVDYAERVFETMLWLLRSMTCIPHHNKAMASIANEHPFIDRLPLTRKCQSQSLRGEALWTSEVLSLGTASSSTKRRSTSDEQYFLTLEPHVPMTLSTPFGRNGSNVKPQPKAIVERGWELDEYGNERKIRRSTRATRVDGLEPGHEYLVRLNHELLEQYKWTPARKEQVLIDPSERGSKGSHVQDYPWETSKTLYMSLELGSHCQVVLQLYYGENHSAKTSHLPPTSLRFPEIPLLTSLYRSSGRLRSFEATEASLIKAQSGWSCSRCCSASPELTYNLPQSG
ncbi:hypothetical protein KCV04_g8, partial [Aureobasidium melanogenum]